MGHGLRRWKRGRSVREDDRLQIDAFCFYVLSQYLDRLGLEDRECRKSLRFFVDSGSHSPTFAGSQTDRCRRHFYTAPILRVQLPGRVSIGNFDGRGYLEGQRARSGRVRHIRSPTFAR